MSLFSLSLSGGNWLTRTFPWWGPLQLNTIKTQLCNLRINLGLISWKTEIKASYHNETTNQFPFTDKKNKVLLHHTNQLMTTDTGCVSVLMETIIILKYRPGCFER
jgi:hypothetical protein